MFRKLWCCYLGTLLKAIPHKCKFEYFSYVGNTKVIYKTNWLGKLIISNKVIRFYSVYLYISFQNKIYMEPQNIKNANNLKLASIHQLRSECSNNLDSVAITSASIFLRIVFWAW